MSFQAPINHPKLWVAEGAPSAALPDFLIDFKNGVYTVGVTSYTLAQAITQTGLVTAGVGLVIPDEDTSPGIQEILGAFLARLIQGQFTLVVSMTGFSIAHNGNSIFLNIQNDALTVWLQWFTINGAGEYNLKIDDHGAPTSNSIHTSGKHYDVGSHKFGITRDIISTVPLALAVDGVLYDWFDPGPMPTGAWTKANFGGDYVNGVNGCRNGCTIESLQCIAAVPLEDLAPLTA